MCLDWSKFNPIDPNGNKLVLIGPDWYKLVVMGLNGGILPSMPFIPGYPCSVPGYPWSVPGFTESVVECP